LIKIENNQHKRNRKLKNKLKYKNSFLEGDFNKILHSLLEKLGKGETLTSVEESYLIASGILKKIIENMLRNLLSSSNSISISNSNLIIDKSVLDDSRMDNSKSNLYQDKRKKKLKSGDSFNPLKNENLADNDQTDKSNDLSLENINSNNDNLSLDNINSNNDNLSFDNNNCNNDNDNNNNNISDDNNNDNLSFDNNNNTSDKNLVNVPNSPEDKWLFKYDDNFFNDLDKNKAKSMQKRKRKKRKEPKLQSQKLMHKILIDFINPKDLKEGLLSQKRFIRALSLNPFKFKEFDEALVKKNMNFLDLNSSESEGELQIKDIKTCDLIRRNFVLKNLNTLTKINNKIRQNWMNIFENPNLEENTKLKFMDILSNKSHLKNKIEEVVLEHINNTLTDDLNSDKNNKLSKKLIKLYREETYNLDVEKYNSEAKNLFGNPTIFSTKAKILQENKDYLISAYFDIYQDILNDVFNSKYSIFEFNDQLKGNSILKNFQIRTDRHLPISKSGEQKYNFVNQIESLKNASNSRRINLFTKESFDIGDRQRMQFREQSNNLNGNNCNFLNLDSLGNNNQMESLETRSNYEKLGLANQTYINNILLRDFTYKEKLQYIENSRSDKVSEYNNTVFDNTSPINDSYSLSQNAASSSNAKKNSIFQKTNLIKFLKDPKFITGNLQNNGLSSNHNQDSGVSGLFNLKGNFDEIFDENNIKNNNNNSNNNKNPISKRKSDSDGFDDDNKLGVSDNDSDLRGPVKKKKRREAVKFKTSKFNQAASAVANKKIDNQPTSFFELRNLNSLLFQF